MLLNSFKILKDRQKRFGWQNRLKTQMEKISIIVPIYNESKYLDECIESLRNQSYANIEIILVDDCSTDDSLEKCKNYALKDSRIIVLTHEKNMGSCAAKNSGLDIAVGEYITFINSDDIIDKTMIEQLKRACEVNKADIAVCDLMYLYPGNNIKKSKYANGDVEVISGKDFDLCYFLYPEMSLENIAVWNKLFRRKLFEEIRFPENKAKESEFITFKLINRSERVAYVHEALYTARQDDKLVIGSDFDNREYDVFDAYNERIKFYEENAMYDMLLYTLKRYMYWLCEYKSKAKIAKCYDSKMVTQYIKIVRETYKKNKLYLPLEARDKKQFMLFGFSFGLYYKIREMQ